MGEYSTDIDEGFSIAAFGNHGASPFFWPKPEESEAVVATFSMVGRLLSCNRSPCLFDKKTYQICLRGFFCISVLRVKLPTFVAAIISELQLVLLTIFDGHSKI